MCDLRWLLLAAAFAASASSLAVANEGTPAQRRACKPYVFRLCNAFIPNRRRIVACLQDNRSRLSAECRAAVTAR